MTTPQLMGVETEYAFNPRSRTQRPVDREAALSGLLRLARELPSVPDIAAPGAFVANGGRLYLDAGNHPEYATPECSSPRELVRFALAGDRILLGLAEQMERQEPDCAVEIYRCNVDYASLHTWGCHESYQYRHGKGRMRRQLVPHLLSRQIYAGAGGLDHRSTGIDFVLSPRVGHLEHESSPHSTEHRGIFHTKDETLVSKAGFHRMHVLCGESLCSQLGSYLKVGTTALVVRLIEADALDVESVAPAEPVAAMAAFTADPRLEVRVPVRRGTATVRALDIQRHYLEAAEANLAAAFVPEWAEELCGHWRATLDVLEAGGADAVARRFDWAIKRRLLEAHATRRGFPAESRAAASRTLRAVERALSSRGVALTSEQRLGLASLDPNRVALAAPILQAAGTTWDALRELLAVRAELCEIDTRFGQLGAAGIFAALERDGVLDHRLPELGSVDAATREPPAFGRARVRGRVVGECASQGDRYVADWCTIYDRVASRSMDLGDPFCDDAMWTEDAVPVSSGDDLCRRVERMLRGRRDASF